MDKKQARLRRARQTRLKIRELRVNRLTVFRTNQHIYASIIDADGAQMLLWSTLRGIVGKRIAEKALAAGIQSVAFDRAGYRFHGRVKALAEAAREAGLKF